MPATLPSVNGPAAPLASPSPAATRSSVADLTNIPQPFGQTASKGSADPELSRAFDRSPTAGPRPVAVHAVMALATLLAGVALGVGIYLAGTTGPATTGGWSLLAGGALGIILCVALWPIAVGVHAASAASRDLAERFRDQLGPIRLDLDRTVQALRSVADRQMLSDRAKQLAFREKDRQALREAFEEDLALGEVEGARQLADELERSFGYKAEADRWRDEIRRRLVHQRERQIEEGVATIDRKCRAEDWAGAHAEAERLQKSHGDDMQVRLLKARIEERRQQMKVQLVDRYRDVVGRGDVDEAVDLLKRLDVYLTPEEGQQLADSAREVFKAKLVKMRDLFSAAMHQHDYAEAWRLGQIIVRDFPNSQLAREVRTHEPRLREAAGIAGPD